MKIKNINIVSLLFLGIIGFIPLNGQTDGDFQEVIFNQIFVEEPYPNTVADLFAGQKLLLDLSNQAQERIDALVIDVKGYIIVEIEGINGAADGIKLISRAPLNNDFIIPFEFSSIRSAMDWEDFTGGTINIDDPFFVINAFQKECENCNPSALTLIDKGLFPNGEYTVCIQTYGFISTFNLTSATPRNQLMPEVLSRQVCAGFNVDGGFQTSIQIANTISSSIEDFINQTRFEVRHNYTINNESVSINSLEQEVQLVGTEGDATGLVINFMMEACSTDIDQPVNIFNLEDITCGDANNYTAIPTTEKQRMLLLNGILPEGVYEICHSIGDASFEPGMPLTPIAKSCETVEINSSFNISADLISPYPNSVFDLFNLPNNLNVTTDHPIENGVFANFNLSLKSDNGLEVDATSEEVTIPFGMNRYEAGVNLEELFGFNLKKEDFSTCNTCPPLVRNLWEQGLFAPGNYELCIEPKGQGNTGGFSLADPICLDFEVAPALSADLVLPPTLPTSIETAFEQIQLDINNQYSRDNESRSFEDVLARVTFKGTSDEATGLNVRFPNQFECGFDIPEQPQFLINLLDVFCGSGNIENVAILNGNSRQQNLIQSGTWPGGDYDICVELVFSNEDNTLAALTEISCSSTNANSLFDFELSMDAPYPNSVHDIFGMPNNLSISTNHDLPDGLLANFRINLKGDNGLDISTATEEINIPVGMNTFSAGVNLEELLDFNFFGGDFSACSNCPPSVVKLLEMGLLAPGDYQLCIEPIGGVDLGNIVLAASKCVDFEVATGLSTELVLPPTLSPSIETSFRDIQLNITNQYRQNNELIGIENMIAQINFRGTSGESAGLEVQFPAQVECVFDVPEQPQFLINLLDVYCGDGNIQNVTILNGDNRQQNLIQSGTWPGGDYEVCVVLGCQENDNTLTPFTELNCNSTTANNLFEFDLALNEPYSNNLANLFNGNGQLQLSTTNNLEENLLANWNIEIIGQANGLNINYNALLAQRPSSIPPQMNTYLSTGGLTDFLEKELDISDFSTCQTCTPEAAYFIEQGLFPAGDYQLCFQPVLNENESLADRKCVEFTIEPQISGELTVNEPFPIALSDLANNSIINAVVNNQYPISLTNISPIFSITGIEGASENLVVNYPQINCLEEIMAGTQNFTFDDLSCSDITNFTVQGTAMQMQQLEEGTLPEGTYRVCFDLVHFESIENAGVLPIIEQQCQTITVENQFTFSINTAPPFSNQVSELFERPNFLQINTENERTTPIENIRFELVIEGQSGIADGLVLALQEPEGNASLVIPPGSTNYTGNGLNDLFDDSNLASLITNGQLNALQADWVESGYFPVGAYRVCVQAFRDLGNQDQPIGELQCATFMVSEPISFTFETNNNFTGNIDNLSQENGLLTVAINNEDLIPAEDLLFDLKISGQMGDALGLAINLTSDDLNIPSGNQVITGNNLANLLDLSGNALIAGIQSANEFQQTQIESGLLPEGVYDICLTTKRQLQNSQQVIDNEQCSSLEVVQPMSLSLMINPPNPATTNDFFDRNFLVATIENGIGKTVSDVHYALELEGIAGDALGLELRAPNTPTFGNFNRDINDGLTVVNSLIDILGFEQFESLVSIPSFNGTDLPQGAYRIRLRIFRKVNEELVAFQSSDWETFEVSSLLDAPEIIFPMEQDVADFESASIAILPSLEESPYLTVQWLLDLGGRTNEGVTYELEFRELPIFSNPSEIQKFRQPDFFAGANILHDYTIEVEDAFAYSTMEDDIQFKDGSVYAMRMLASSPSFSFTNEGYSQVVFFRFGAETPLSDIPENVPLYVMIQDDVIPNYPVWGDTIPFRSHPYVVQLTNHGESYQGFSFDHSVFQVGLDGQIESFRNDFPETADNRWPKGPLDYLKDNFSDVEDPSIAYHFRVNQQVKDERDWLVRGKEYRWKFEPRLQVAGYDEVLSPDFDLSYHVGMPTPQLNNYKNGETVAPGEINLAWHTGNPPRQLLPTYVLTKMEGNSGPTFQYIGPVKERYVLQISSDEEFTNILQTEDGLIEYDNANMDFNGVQYDASFALSALYKDMETSITVDVAGDYFWRVLYLSNPERSENYESLYEQDYYRSSAVGRFVVEGDGPIADGGDDDFFIIELCAGPKEQEIILEDYDEDYGEELMDEILVEMGEGEENVNTDCETACNFEIENNNPIADYSGFEQLNIGYFTVEDIDYTNETGIVKIPFINATIKVALEGIRVNAEGRIIDGVVKAVNDSGFDWLDELNQNITGLSEEFGKIPGLPTEEVNNVSDDLTNLVEEYDEEARILLMLAGEPVGMPIGLNQEIEGHQVQLALTEISFYPQGATCTIMYDHQFQGSTIRIVLGASEICFKPTGFQQQVIVHLQQDLVIPYGGDEANPTNIIVKGSAKTANSDRNQRIESIRDNATYFEIGCDGLKGLAVRCAIDFPREVLLPDAPNGLPGEGVVQGRFGFSFRKIDAGEYKKEKEKLITDAVLDEDSDKKVKLNDLNFLLEFEMDDFQIAGLDGWGFSLDQGYVDLSTFDNPRDAQFPENYLSSMNYVDNNMWTGFYLGEISLRFPPDFIKENGENAERARLEAGLKGIIIDEQGLSASIFLRNILKLEEGQDIDGWAFSIDTFSVNFVKNNFVSGNLNGQIGVPFMAEEEHLDYQAVLAYSPEEKKADQWGFFLGVDVDGSIKIPAWIADITIKENSYVHLKYGTVPEEVVNSPNYVDTLRGPTIYLHGNLNISSTNGDAEVLRDVAATVGFNGMNASIFYNQYIGIDTSKTFISFASPQKYMGVNNEDGDNGGISGFPITIDNFNIDSKIDPEKGCIGLAIGFDTKINFSDQLSASLGLIIGASYDTNIKRFDFDQFEVTCITVKSEINGITLDGEVCFQDETMCGLEVEGISGTLKVGLPVATVDLAAAFGIAKNEATGKEFRYWFVDGKVMFGESGLSMGTLALYGLSGGVYYNLKPTSSVVSVKSTSGKEQAYDDTTVKNVGELTNHTGNEGLQGASGLSFCPNEGSYLFKAGLVLGTNGDPSVFNMDVAVSVGIDKDIGLNYFSIVGNGYIMADFEEREKAAVIADIIIEYQKDNCDEETKECEQTFHAGFTVYVDMNYEIMTIKGAGGMKKPFNPTIGEKPVFVDAQFNYFDPIGEEGTVWAFKMGSPKLPAGVDFNLGGAITAQSKFYLQAGNNIDKGFMEPLPFIKDMLNLNSTGGQGGSLSDFDQVHLGENKNDIVEGKSKPDGFIAGFQFYTKAEIDLFLLYATLEAGFGFDANLLKYKEGFFCMKTEESGERTFTPGGENNFYAQMQMYAGIKGEIGLKISFIKEMRFHLLSLGAALYVEGGFPNPTWAKGRAGVEYSVMGGMISGQAMIDFEVGEVCVPPVTDPFGFAIIQDIIPEEGQKEVDLSVQPEVSFSLPINVVKEYPIIEEINGEVVKSSWFLIPFIERMEIRKGTKVIASYQDGGFEKAPILYNTSFDFYDNNKVVQLFNEALLDEEADYEFYILMKARELTSNSARLVKVFDKEAPNNEKIWSEERTVKFTTGTLPDIVEGKRILASNPMPLQNYFLKTSFRRGQLVFKNVGIGQHYFYPEKEGKTYEYYACFVPFDNKAFIEEKINTRVTNLYNNECADRSFGCETGPSRRVFEARFSIPIDLGNEQIYSLQFVRKLTSGLYEEGNQEKDGVNINYYSYVGESYEAQTSKNPTILFNEGQFNVIAKDLRPDKVHIESDKEFVLFNFPFRTSRFNTLEEKMAKVTKGQGAWFLKHFFDFSISEPFDKIDLYGLTRPIPNYLYIRDKNLPAVLPKIGFVESLESPYKYRIKGVNNYLKDLYSNAKTLGRQTFPATHYMRYKAYTDDFKNGLLEGQIEVDFSKSKLNWIRYKTHLTFHDRKNDRIPQWETAYYDRYRNKKSAMEALNPLQNNRDRSLFFKNSSGYGRERNLFNPFDNFSKNDFNFRWAMTVPYDFELLSSIFSIRKNQLPINSSRNSDLLAEETIEQAWALVINTNTKASSTILGDITDTNTTTSNGFCSIIYDTPDKLAQDQQKLLRHLYRIRSIKYDSKIFAHPYQFFDWGEHTGWLNPNPKLQFGAVFSKIYKQKFQESNGRWLENFDPIALPKGTYKFGVVTNGLFEYSLSKGDSFIDVKF